MNISQDKINEIGIKLNSKTEKNATAHTNESLLCVLFEKVIDRIVARNNQR